MQQLTNRSRAVMDKKMTFSERIYLPAILGGMWITLKHFFRKPATSQYPEQVRSRSEVYRGQHVLKRDEQGKERCTACGLCAVACPAEAITMVAAEREKGEEYLYREEKYAAIYEIDMLRCIFVVCVKKPVRRKPFSLQIVLLMRNLEEKTLFMAKTNWLNQLMLV